MQKTIKIVSVLLMVMMLCFSLSTVVMATDEKSDASTIINTMDSQDIGTAMQTNISKVGGKIADVISTVGVIVAVIVLLVLGVKYMIGSASEKAEYKKTMIPYLVGAVLLIGASAIVGAIFNFNF